RWNMGRRKRYSAEFKREALRRANEPGVTDVLVAEELGINARQLRRWRDAEKRDGENAFPGEGNSRDEELTRLKRKLAKVEQERDFLREAAAYFAKESK
ncbi:MAG: transposase, partial [Gammaproteobacteria bacterium]|nr:transposase [Gammaproteobacteria bacterium]